MHGAPHFGHHHWSPPLLSPSLEPPFPSSFANHFLLLISSGPGPSWSPADPTAFSLEKYLLDMDTRIGRQLSLTLYSGGGWSWWLWLAFDMYDPTMDKHSRLSYHEHCDIHAFIVFLEGVGCCITAWLWNSQYENLFTYVHEKNLRRWQMTNGKRNYSLPYLLAIDMVLTNCLMDLLLVLHKTAICWVKANCSCIRCHTKLDIDWLINATSQAACFNTDDEQNCQPSLYADWMFMAQSWFTPASWLINQQVVGSIQNVKERWQKLVSWS